MMPTGPSPRTNGSFISSSSAVMIKGREKASVFPEPVKAIPITSRPANLDKGIEYGNPIGAYYSPTLQEYLAAESASALRSFVRGGIGGKAEEFSYPTQTSIRSKARHWTDRLTAKCSIGGGISSPSTMMWYFSRNMRCCSSDRSRIYFGGTHLIRRCVRRITTDRRKID
jgi:hypothetical protein